jgi:NADPH:quinone reductase-like Zn-dependent oxidoreductase
MNGDSKVHLLAEAVSPSDVQNVDGKMVGTTLPRVPGRDFACVVLDGPADLVGVEVWDTGGEVGLTRDGDHGEFITIPANAASRKPRNLAFEQAASGHNAE